VGLDFGLCLLGNKGLMGCLNCWKKYIGMVDLKATDEPWPKWCYMQTVGTNGVWWKTYTFPHGNLDD